MRVLVGCEFTGTVREAFAALGHDAWSCDIIPSERPGKHIQANVLTVLNDGWDLLIGHPPCTYLSYAGANQFHKPGRMDKSREAFEFFMALVNAPIPHIAIENPRGLPLKWYRPADQKIEPYQFGHPVKKATYLWLKALPPLIYTNIHTDYMVNWVGKGLHKGGKAKSRSRTFQGIAEAMATQWSAHLERNQINHHVIYGQPRR